MFGLACFGEPQKLGAFKAGTWPFVLGIIGTLTVLDMVCLQMSREDIINIGLRCNTTYSDISSLRRLGICSTATHRGCRGSGHKKPISAISDYIANDNSHRPRQHGCNIANLTAVPTSNQPMLRVGHLNVRSVCNKALTLCEYIKDNDLDVFGLTETWLKPKDQGIIAELVPPGYSMQHITRPTRGGGVAMIHRDSINVISSECQTYKSFEYVERKIVSRSSSYLFVVLYRPPPSSKNALSVPLFIEEFGRYLESVLITRSNLVICGDFNFHLDNPVHADTQKFQALLNSTGLKQHVTEATHASGHLLDIVLTRANEPISGVEVQDGHISDHSSVFFCLSLAKPPLPTQEIHYRKLKGINMDNFKADIVKSGLPEMQHEDVDILVETYNSTLTKILDQHAPLKSRTVTIHPNAPWMTDGIKEVKREKRKAERKMRQTGLVIHKEIYIEYRNKMNRMITDSKKDFYKQRIDESSNSQSQLFKCVNELFGRRKCSALPTHDNVKELCDRMAEFFSQKIKAIHEGLADLQDESIRLEPDEQFSSPDCFTDFAPVTEEEVGKIIRGSAPKSCCLDPAPTQLIKDSLDILLPIITRIINQSFASAKVPKSFKIAAVTPILKKIDLIAEILKNFRPISNLPFLSKVMEKVAVKQLTSHKEDHNLREKFQSAYRKFHSTETALVRIHHDLRIALDSKQCIMMVMLDLSAAFDTVNHSVLLNRLSERYGIRSNAHAWISSYLSERKQFITIKGERSDEQNKDCDVPQGSVFGPSLYEDYTAAPLGAIFRRHGISFHIYADDTQVYVPFHISEEQECLARLESCLEEVKHWMAANWLKLNDDKTEFIIFGSKQQLSQVTTTAVRVGDATITTSPSVKSIGAHLDSLLKMDTQLAATCKAAWYHLYQISKIRKYLTEEQTKSVVHAHVTCRLDQNNSMMIGMPKKSLGKLQIIQNASARLIAGIRKCDHITPTLKRLHWLPTEQRVVFKVLLLAFKAMNDKGPDYLKELLVSYTPTRTLRSSYDSLLCVPNTHYTDTSKRAFGVRAPQEWNKLPSVIRSKNSVASFKTALKTHLFKVAFG